MLTRPRPAIRRIAATLLLFMVVLHGGPSFAQAAGPLPKWGRATSATDLGIGDRKFLADTDRQYQGDRPKASTAIAADGWKMLRQGKSDAAMLRFNQAWLLHANNGNALWGMGQIAANRGQAADSLKLFTEANRLIGFDLDFAVDYARALSLAGLKLGDKKLSDEAFLRFAQIQARAPQHTLNLQNWAIAFFYAGQYAAAWDKIKAAQATPRGAEVDKKFLADLQAKMPRP
jgi:tetratricopeptide (TPR) repeat protein